MCYTVQNAVHACKHWCKTIHVTMMHVTINVSDRSYYSSSFNHRYITQPNIACTYTQSLQPYIHLYIFQNHIYIYAMTLVRIYNYITLWFYSKYNKLYAMYSRVVVKTNLLEVHGDRFDLHIFRTGYRPLWQKWKHQANNSNPWLNERHQGNRYYSCDWRSTNSSLLGHGGHSVHLHKKREGAKL